VTKSVSTSIPSAPPAREEGDRKNKRMSLANSAFPSSAAFDAINQSLQSSDADRKDAIKKGGAVFAFTLKNNEGQEESWYIDLKEKGVVGKGAAPEGGKANGECTSISSSLSGSSIQVFQVKNVSTCCNKANI
jgi:hypothetical protein